MQWPLVLATFATPTPPDAPALQHVQEDPVTWWLWIRKIVGKKGVRFECTHALNWVHHGIAADGDGVVPPGIKSLPKSCNTKGFSVEVVGICAPPPSHCCSTGV